jgi:hypothetical protein
MAVSDCSKAGSSLVDTFLQSILGFADRLLGFAFLFLYDAFGAQLVITGGLADALLDVTGCFVGHAFYLIACAAHGISPANIQWRKSGYTGLTEGDCGEFHLFSLRHFIDPLRLGFMFFGQPLRMRNVFRPWR